MPRPNRATKLRDDRSTNSFVERNIYRHCKISRRTQVNGESCLVSPRRTHKPIQKAPYLRIGRSALRTCEHMVSQIQWCRFAAMPNTSCQEAAHPQKNDELKRHPPARMK